MRRDDITRFLICPGLSLLALNFLHDNSIETKCYTTSHGLWVHVKPGCRCGKQYWFRYHTY